VVFFRGSRVASKQKAIEMLETELYTLKEQLRPIEEEKSVHAHELKEAEKSFALLEDSLQIWVEKFSLAQAVGKQLEQHVAARNAMIVPILMPQQRQYMPVCTDGGNKSSWSLPDILDKILNLDSSAAIDLDCCNLEHDSRKEVKEKILPRLKYLLDAWRLPYAETDNPNVFQVFCCACKEIFDKKSMPG
jgi:hypothetical protein